MRFIDYDQTDDPKIFYDKGDSGVIVERHFCRECGSPIVSILERSPGLIVVKGGGLDNPGSYTPTLGYYEKSSLPWSKNISDIADG